MHYLYIIKENNNKIIIPSIKQRNYQHVVHVRMRSTLPLVTFAPRCRLQKLAMILTSHMDFKELKDHHRCKIVKRSGLICAQFHDYRVPTDWILDIDVVVLAACSVFIFEADVS